MSYSRVEWYCLFSLIALLIFLYVCTCVLHTGIYVSKNIFTDQVAFTDNWWNKARWYVVRYISNLLRRLFVWILSRSVAHVRQSLHQQQFLISYDWTSLEIRSWNTDPFWVIYFKQTSLNSWLENNIKLTLLSKVYQHFENIISHLRSYSVFNLSNSLQCIAQRW